ncbi:putative phage tail protein [Xanthobacter sp. KR7-225]|uniref:YmfQ family protein n=1 Tax=Xanthobacter sp. KR7-225 TaxID=3156613 RepID=UPI0032B410B5
MSRSAAEIHREALSLLPPGMMWSRSPDTLLAAVLEPLAGLLADLEASAEAMMDEVDPRSAVACLEDFERVLGPDPCGRDLATLSLPQRQQLAHQRWTARGGQSPQYFIDLAAARGVAITIEEVHPSQAGVLCMDDELVEPPEQFIWRVLIPLGTWDDFRVDESAMDDRLYDFQPSDVECDIMRAAPAHTSVVFTYLPVDEEE